MHKKELFRLVIEYFKEKMPSPETELAYRSPYELICAVILSAQCTDKRVNMITPELFIKYPDIINLSKASSKEVFNLISSCSYPNNKSKHLVNMARHIKDHHSGEIPSNLADLLKVPGVGRKTANVLLSVLYKKPGFAVDTHVFRVAERIGLTNGSKNPEETERILTANFPTELIPDAHHWLILHGRYVCKARNPECKKCGLSNICKYYNSKKL